MKGHLDVKELGKYKKADLQKLAEELGVSTEGTIKELAERCAEVEVEIPDESELTEEEKEAAEQAAAEYAEENGQEEPEKDDEPQATGTVTVEVTAMYLDKVLNTPCIFSRDFDNVNEQEYTASIENCGNFIYVQGAADDSGSQPIVTVDGEGATGIELDEVFCDATDIARKYQSGETEVTIPLSTYLQMLKTRGETELEGYGKNINFVSTINTNSNLKFKVDFDLGDRITCKEEKWGIQIDARITEVKEIYQKGTEEIEATFGESLPTLVDKIRKVR